MAALQMKRTERGPREDPPFSAWKKKLEGKADTMNLGNVGRARAETRSRGIRGGPGEAAPRPFVPKVGVTGKRSGLAERHVKRRYKRSEKLKLKIGKVKLRGCRELVQRGRWRIGRVGVRPRNRLRRKDHDRPTREAGQLWEPHPPSWSKAWYS